MKPMIASIVRPRLDPQSFGLRDDLPGVGEHAPDGPLPTVDRRDPGSTGKLGRHRDQPAVVDVKIGRAGDSPDQSRVGEPTQEVVEEQSKGAPMYGGCPREMRAEAHATDELLAILQIDGNRRHQAPLGRLESRVLGRVRGNPGILGDDGQSLDPGGQIAHDPAAVVENDRIRLRHRESVEQTDDLRGEARIALPAEFARGVRDHVEVLPSREKRIVSNVRPTVVIAREKSRIHTHDPR
nr:MULTISPECIES: hypothetical protein [unclassified Frankia]